MESMAGARHYQSLIVWQLGDEIRRHVFQLTARAPLATRFKTRDQLDDAANSICRNVAEGFSSGSDPAFAHYLTISRDSLNELKDSLRGARLQGLVSHDELLPIFALAHRESHALSNFIAYLRRRDDDDPDAARKRR
jgi:four helix bundle protein